MFKRLAEPGLYVAALEHVAAKQRKRHAGLLPACPGGPSLQQLLLESRALSHKLARLVSRGEYTLAPLERRTALIEGRERTLYRASPLDLVVMSALADVLGATLEAGLSARLFSYRRGYSTLGALREASTFLRQHVRTRSDPRTRGVYVVRRDVRAYGDSIPSHDDAALWQLLTSALASQGVSLDPSQLVWLRSVIRPDVLAADGTAQPPTRGIPTGSPLQPIMGNLYLGQLDKTLAQVDEAFYARFGDDLLFIHHLPEQAQAAADTIDDTLHELQLALSEGKCASLYLTAPGRCSPVAGFRGQRSFDYLGRRLDAHGAIGLNQPKARRLLQNVDRRLGNLANVAADLPRSERARLMCSAVNASIDPAAIMAQRSAGALATEQTDYQQLRQLDHQLAQRVARAVSGQRGVRAFRGLAPHLLRGEFGLQSLVRQRVAYLRSSGQRP